MKNLIYRANLAYNVALDNVRTRKTYAVCPGSKYQEYKQFSLFDQALYRHYTILCLFSSKFKFMKLVLLLILLM